MAQEQTLETKVALIQQNVEGIKVTQNRMEIKLDALQGIFWTTKGHEEFVVDVNKRFAVLENQAGFQKYVLPIVSSVLTAVITFLLISFLQKVR